MCPERRRKACLMLWRPAPDHTRRGPHPFRAQESRPDVQSSGSARLLGFPTAAGPPEVRRTRLARNRHRLQGPLRFRFSVRRVHERPFA